MYQKHEFRDLTILQSYFLLKSGSSESLKRRDRTSSREPICFHICLIKFKSSYLPWSNSWGLSLQKLDMEKQTILILC